jgi:catechol 2,3-dioxygenase-like lactoylglutathione lyase family enzyme
MIGALSEEWYARPVLFVTDIDRTLDFYVHRLGFTQSWKFEEEGQAFVAQADRQGCALIFSSQWPEKVGKGLIFISLNVDAAPDKLRTEVGLALDRLRIEFDGKGVEVEEGFWGYKLLVVRDPDGNELYFNYPDADEAAPAETAQ